MLNNRVPYFGLDYKIPTILFAGAQFILWSVQFALSLFTCCLANRGRVVAFKDEYWPAGRDRK